MFEWEASREQRGNLDDPGDADAIAFASQRPCSTIVLAPPMTEVSPQLAFHEVEAVSSVHSIAPSFSVILMGSASTKKSFTCQLTTDFMTKSRFAPENIANGDAFMVEASVKGIRLCILNNNRVDATTDEIVNTFPTPWGDHRESGAHINHLCRSKLNTWTQGERDDVATAQGRIHLSNNAFRLKAFGQIGPCKWVWRPSENGWQKRLSVAISPTKNQMDEDVNADFSMGLWQGCHDFMFRGPARKPAYINLDPFALSIFRTVRRATDDWLESKAADQEEVDKYLVAKVGFVFSDLRAQMLRNF